MSGKKPIWVNIGQELGAHWVPQCELPQSGEPDNKRRRVAFAMRRWSSVNLANAAATAGPTRPARPASAARYVEQPLSRPASAASTASAASAASADSTHGERGLNARLRPGSPHFPRNYNHQAPPNLNDDETDLYRQVQIIGRHIQNITRRTNQYKNSLKSSHGAINRPGSPIFVIANLISIVNRAKNVNDEDIVSNVRKDLFKAVETLRNKQTLGSWRRTAQTAKENTSALDKIDNEAENAAEALASILSAARFSR